MKTQDASNNTPSVVRDPFKLTNYETPIFLTLAESKDLLKYKMRKRIYILLSQERSGKK